MSQRNSGYLRREAYETPAWVTASLLPHLPRGIQGVWEPAAGDGAMVGVLNRHYTVISTDLRLGMDFLACKAAPAGPAIDAIITNPPYELADEFCHHALHLMEPAWGVVAMLLRVDFDSGKTRAALFRDCRAWMRKVTLLKRIVWFQPPPSPDGKKPAGPSENHAWYIWDWRNRWPPTIGYAP